MVKYDETGKVIGELLDYGSVMSEKQIEKFNYTQLKNDFEDVVDQLVTNKMVHSLYKDRLSFCFDKELKFRVYIPENVVTVMDDEDGKHTTYGTTELFSMDSDLYKKNEKLCEMLLLNVYSAFNELNEAERFIIKTLEFDKYDKLVEKTYTDEELQELLIMYKNKYYQCKRSAYIKLGLQLKVEDARQNDVNRIATMKYLEEIREKKENYQVN